jgi:[ribosomal protein S5]-alanine N-acetyltransferase
MNLQTNRLNLREILLTDVENIHALNSLPETDRFNTLGIPASIETTEKLVSEYIEEQNKSPRSSYVFCIEQAETKQFIGLIALNLAKPKFKRAEVWYNVHVAYWRKGYATESLKKLIEFGFNELQLHRIEAGCAVENIYSAKVLEKAGMNKEGMKRKNLPIRGEWIDSFFYSILDEEFLKK